MYIEATKSVYLEFGPHPEDNPHLLDHIKEAAILHLKTKPGRVGIAIESAYKSAEESAAVGLLSLQMPVSHAYALLENVYEHPEVADEDAPQLLSEVELKTLSAKSKYLDELNPRDRSVLILLDNLYQEFPGRIMALYEGNPEGEIDRDKVLSQQENDLYNQAFERIVDGQFDQAILPFKQACFLRRETTLGFYRNRDGRIASLIRNVLLNEDLNITFIAGYFGAIHTPIYYILKKMGFNVTHSFPETGENNIYFYDPYTMASRYLQFFPDREITDEQWLKFLYAHTLYKFISRIAEDSEQQMSYQTRLDFVYTFTKGCAIDQVRAFEAYIRRYGPEEALVKVMEKL